MEERSESYLKKLANGLKKENYFVSAYFNDSITLKNISTSSQSEFSLSGDSSLLAMALNFQTNLNKKKEKYVKHFVVYDKMF